MIYQSLNCCYSLQLYQNGWLRQPNVLCLRINFRLILLVKIPFGLLLVLKYVHINIFIDILIMYISCSLLFQHKALCCHYKERASMVCDIIQVYSGAHGKTMVFTSTKNEANELALNSVLKQECQVNSAYIYTMYMYIRNLFLCTLQYVMVLQYYSILLNSQYSTYCLFWQNNYNLCTCAVVSKIVVWEKMFTYSVSWIETPVVNWHRVIFDILLILQDFCSAK